MTPSSPTLLIFSGLPGSGKTLLAQELARQLNAVYVRIDSIEQRLRKSQIVGEDLKDAGYRVAYAIAEDNLRLGRGVIADSVNPIEITRQAWLDVASRTGAHPVEVEVQCSDITEHRRRVENREADIPGLQLPNWDQVLSRNYESWDRPHLVIDTATRSVEENVEIIRHHMALQKKSGMRPELPS